MMGNMPPEAMAVWMLHDGQYAARSYGWYGCSYDGNMPPEAMAGMDADMMGNMPPEAMAGMDASHDGSYAARSYGWYGC